jgi:hypothetical protein
VSNRWPPEWLATTGDTCSRRCIHVVADAPSSDEAVLGPSIVCKHIHTLTILSHLLSRSPAYGVVGAPALELCASRETLEWNAPQNL